MKKIFIFKLICGVCLPIIATHSFSNELGEIQQEIARQQNKVAEKQQSKVSLQEEVKQFLQTLTKTQQKLQAISNELADSETTQHTLEQDVQKLNATIQQQKNTLAKIITTIYKAKLNPNFIEQLLAKDTHTANAVKYSLTRLYQEKTALLTHLKQSEHTLHTRQAQIAQQQAFILKQKATLQQLVQQQQKESEAYQQSLAKLQAQLQQEEQKLAELKANETALRAKIAQAERQAKKSLPDKDLGLPKHQYIPPVKGEIIHQFASPQLGELRWRGIVIASPKGTPVYAIAKGQVIFAGKLAGYGLIVIVKHGKADLALYGYNQRLTVKTGDIIQAGQMLAEVGFMNGTSQSGLYFEISRRGEVVNPVDFLNGLETK